MKKTCEVCKKELFKYECPKCEIVYCSRECYKRHNDGCVNHFFENQMKQDMERNKLTDLDKKEFKHKLKQFYEKNAENDFLLQHINDKGECGGYDSDHKSECEGEDAEDEVEVEDTGGELKHLKKWCVGKKRYKVLTELALKDELDLENLNATEKKQFFSFLKSKKLDVYFKDFEPWWLDCVIKKVPTSEHLCCNIKLNENVIYIVIEVLYSYCYLLRIHYGEMELQDFCYSILYLANSLNRESLPQTDVLSTINFLFQRIMENDNFPREKVLLYNIIIDVTKILSIKDLILRCLNECKSYYKNFRQSIKLVKDNNGKNSQKKEERLKEKALLKYVYKKIKFLYSFSFYHYEKFGEIKNKLTVFYDQQMYANRSNEKRTIVFNK